MADRTIFRKELLSLAIPLALQNLLQTLVGASDALMLGRLTLDFFLVHAWMFCLPMACHACVHE